MSWREQRRKRTPRGRTLRSSRKPSEDDMPLSLLALIAAQNVRSKRKPTPRKIATRSTAAAAVAVTDEIIDLDAPQTAEIVNNVNSKVGSFLQSGSFISSDEDETEMIKAKTNKKASPNQFFISDDSDDDCKVVDKTNCAFDVCKPGTSTGSGDNHFKDIKSQVTEDDLMVLVDSVLENKDKNKGDENALKDMKSLEDYRKETEEMLKNASCLLDEIKSGRKPENEKKEEVSSPKVSIGCCSICLESLASRPTSVTVCGHIFCKECITRAAQTSKKCPTCRKPINRKKIHPIYL